MLRVFDFDCEFVFLRFEIFGSFLQWIYDTILVAVKNNLESVCFLHPGLQARHPSAPFLIAFDYEDIKKQAAGSTQRHEVASLFKDRHDLLFELTNFLSNESKAVPGVACGRNYILLESTSATPTQMHADGGMLLLTGTQ